MKEKERYGIVMNDRGFLTNFCNYGTEVCRIESWNGIAMYKI